MASIATYSGGPLGELKDKRDRLLQRYQSLKQDRVTFDAHWREIADVTVPVRPRFTLDERNKGSRRNTNIIDSTARYAARTLQAGLHAGLTSPARPWMKLTTPDPNLAKRAAVKQWLYEVTERMHVIFQLSNLYNALPIVYGDMGTFGTAAMAALEDPGTNGQAGDLVRFYPYALGTYVLATDNRGLASTFAREYRRTVAQVVEEFGGPDGRPMTSLADKPDWSRFSSMVKTAYEQGQYETTVDVLWLVYPNREHARGAYGAAGFPWSSCYLELASSKNPDDTAGILRESGFNEFPIMAPRWYVNPDDTYGTDCPGMMTLGDVRQLQAQQRKKGQAIAKLVDPPLQGPQSVRTQKISSLPGDLSYVDASSPTGGIKPLYEVKPDLQAFVLDIQETQYRIKQGYFVDLFLMLANSDLQRGSQPLTAREVAERHEEKLIQLGPVLDSTQDELLDPLVDRTFAMMEREGLVPPAPEELQGVHLVVEYISILAQAQKLAGVAAADRFLQTVVGLGQVDQRAFHKVNTFAIIDDYGDRLGVPPAYIIPDEDAQAAVEQQAKAAQAQADAERNLQEANAAKTLSETNVEADNSALRRIVEGVTA